MSRTVNQSRAMPFEVGVRFGAGVRLNRHSRHWLRDSHQFQRFFRVRRFATAVLSKRSTLYSQLSEFIGGCRGRSPCATIDCSETTAAMPASADFPHGTPPEV